MLAHSFLAFSQPIGARFLPLYHSELREGVEDLGDGFLRLAFVVAGEGGGVHGGSFELVADGADLGLERLRPRKLGRFVGWSFGRFVGAGGFGAGGEF